MQPPTTPRPPSLPFGDLGWERFEQFGHDLLPSLPGMRPGTAHRYGTQGQAQRGIDLIVDREDGRRWAFSNKRYKRYQPHHVGEHIAETTYHADRFVILISGIASPEVRDEIRKHAGWELWDAEDLSQCVRLNVPPETARRLVDHHFGSIWRRDFLGLPAVGAFLSPPDYFRPLLDRSRLFHHDFPLIGRQSLLDVLSSLAGSGPQRVMMLSGRGGIGKSRLLREWANQMDAIYPCQAVRFLNDSVPITQEALDELPSVPCLIAVDDAHRRTDLALLLAWLRQRPDCKLLLAGRPQGLDYLQAELARGGFDPSQIRCLPPLEKLTDADIAQLAALVLGNDHDGLAERLTRVTRDCPLVTVVGGRLLVERAVAPELLERDNDFRQAVLTRFREETLGQVGEIVSPQLVRRLLELLAALAPVPANAGPFHQRLATFLNADAVDVTRALGELERVGLLVRRNQAVRVVPDVLADHILAGACLTPQGGATGFADRVFADFATDCLGQLLRNMAELDWRVRTNSGDQSPLLDRAWQTIQANFRAGSHRARAQLLEQFRDSAYFLPGRVLELARFAIQHPAETEREEVVSGCLAYTHGDVIRAVPELLSRCSYAPECLPTCLDLLWELDGDDGRATNTNPDHPFRIISEIAAYQPDKPLWVNRAVLEAVRRWLRRPDSANERHSPLDVLDPLLEKSGMTQEADGRRLRLRSFYLHYDSVRELRDCVLELLTECLRSPDLRLILRAVHSLGHGLNGPAPYLGLGFTDDDLQQWATEQTRILDILGGVVEHLPIPVVTLSVLQAARHQSRFGRLESVRARAAALVASIDRSFDFLLTRSLLPKLSHWDLFEEDAGAEPTVGHEERRQAFARQVATEFWHRFPEPAMAVAEVDRRVRELEVLDRSCDAAFLIWWLFETRPELVQPFVRHLLGLPGSPLAPCLRAGLGHLHRREPAVAVIIACDAIATGAVVFRQAVAYHFAWNLRPDAPLQDGEVGLVQTLLADADAGVRTLAAGALRRIGAFEPHIAINLARSVGVDASLHMVVELCRLVDPHWDGCPDAFTDEDVTALLAVVEKLDDLGHEIAPFLAFACTRTPAALIDMLLRRIDRQETEGYRSGRRPIPHHTLNTTFAGLSGTARHAELLRHIRDRAVNRETLALQGLADLYRDASLGYGAAGLEVLTEWLRDGNGDQLVAAAALLAEAGTSFVFDHLELVSDVLDRAAVFGDEYLARVARVFFRLATWGMKCGAPGEPFPQDLDLRNRCQAILPRLPPGRPAHQLVHDILRSTQRDIDAACRELEDE